MSKKVKEEEKKEEVKQEETALKNNEGEAAVALTEADKINFFKSFLEDLPFVDTLTSLGGALKLTFRSLTSAENMDIYSELKKAQNNGELTSDANYITQLTCSRVALTLVSINDVPFQPDITAQSHPLNTEDKSYVLIKADTVKGWSVHKLTTIVESFKIFENKLMALIKEVQTENFWPADK